MDRMFAMCRGVDGATALSMKKWIDSNYHFMVPEVDRPLRDLNLLPDFTSYIANIKRGIAALGAKATPVVHGPVSTTRFVDFKGTTNHFEQMVFLEKLLPIYTELLAEIAALGVEEIQIHEPTLVFAETRLTPLFKMAYTGSTSILPPSGQCKIIWYHSSRISAKKITTGSCRPTELTSSVLTSLVEITCPSSRSVAFQQPKSLELES